MLPTDKLDEPGDFGPDSQRQQTIRRLNSRINAFSHIPDSPLHHSAKGTNEKVRSGRPLEGVSLSIKDSFHVQGMPRRHGSATHPGTISTTNSVPVERLLDAGAVIVGKTTMPDYGLIASGISSAYDVTRNPWDLTASPGGSSSGAGAAVASGCSTMAIGTDIAGSVRLPAAHCGITAFKPTQGTIAYAPASTWRSAGPMARTVAETRLLYTVLAGKHSTDQLSADPLPGGSAPRRLSGLRIGVIEWPGYGPTMDGPTGIAVAGALEALQSAGALLEEVEPFLDDEDFKALDRSLMVRCHAELGGCPPELRSQLLAEVAQWAEAGRDLSAIQLQRDGEQLSATASRLSALFDDYDLIVSPVMGDHRFPAEQFGPRLDRPLLHHANFTAWFNQTGQPAIVIPVSLSQDDHPIGLQLAMPRFQDHELLDIAEAVEQLIDLQLTYPVL